jgi:hypothetical protein
MKRRDEPNYSRGDIFALVMLELGPMPHPELPPYEDYWSGRTQTDSLGHEENMKYKRAVKRVMKRLGHTVPSDVDLFVRNQRKRDR